MQGLNFWSFRGIPYAQSPVEELRFQLPQPVKRWNDTLDAFKCGPECPQFNILTRYIVGNRWAHTGLLKRNFRISHIVPKIVQSLLQHNLEYKARKLQHSLLMNSV